MQVRFETERLWEFARLDSLALEFAPLLAGRVLGEAAAVGDLHPEGAVAEVVAGSRVELVCDIGARFTEDTQAGFDAVRVFTPAEGVLRGLEMGAPWEATTPDSVVAEAGGFVAYLPQPIQQDGVQRLRLRLETALYSAAGEIAAEVFARGRAGFSQLVVAGDVSEDMGTNQLRIVAAAQGSVLAAMEVEPVAFTRRGRGERRGADRLYAAEGAGRARGRGGGVRSARSLPMAHRPKWTGGRSPCGAMGWPRSIGPVGWTGFVFGQGGGGDGSAARGADGMRSGGLLMSLYCTLYGWRSPRHDGLNNCPSFWGQTL